VVFECFHNFVALSHCGNTIFGIMSRLAEDGGDPAVRALFQKTMSGNFDDTSDAPFPPLELSSWNCSASSRPTEEAFQLSMTLEQAPTARRHSKSSACHWNGTATSARRTPAPVWIRSTGKTRMRSIRKGIFRFPPVPRSMMTNAGKSAWRSPFDITNFEVKDGRKANITNSGFGKVFGVVDGTSHPVCDYAGFAPFGFGYRRCPGEQLTIHVFEDFLRKVWRDNIAFRKLNLANPGRVPIGPNAVIQDDLGFSRSA
jgi:hypothetical protein